MSPERKRLFVVLGWAAMIDFFLLGLIGSFSVYSISSWFGIAFWGGLLFVWIRMGWRGAKSARERGWAAIAVVLLFLAGVGAAVLVVLRLS
jgi:ABC-type uncharacterized transport system permease subunit